MYLHIYMNKFVNCLPPRRGIYKIYKKKKQFCNMVCSTLFKYVGVGINSIFTAVQIVCLFLV